MAPPASGQQKVEIRLANGDTIATKTKRASYVCGGLALVEVEGRAGCYTTRIENVQNAWASEGLSALASRIPS